MAATFSANRAPVARTSGPESFHGKHMARADGAGRHDVVCGFQHPGEAKRFLGDLGERLIHDGLERHPDRTRAHRFHRTLRRIRGERLEVRHDNRDKVAGSGTMPCRAAVHVPLQATAHARPSAATPRRSHDRGGDRHPHRRPASATRGQANGSSSGPEGRRARFLIARLTSHRLRD